MSEEFVRLVIGLTPPQYGRYQVDSPTASRDRFLLFVLAWLADDDGVCSVSKTELEAYMLVRSKQVVEARQRLVAHGLIEFSSTAGVPAPATYRLRRDVLETRQMGVVRRESGSVYVLEDFGVPRSVVNSLARCGIENMAALAAAVDRYEALPVEERQGFHVYVTNQWDARHFGRQGGVRVLEALARWRAG